MRGQVCVSSFRGVVCAHDSGYPIGPILCDTGGYLINLFLPHTEAIAKCVFVLSSTHFLVFVLTLQPKVQDQCENERGFW